MGPRLLVLDDYEGRVASAPVMARLRDLAEVTVLDRPLTDADLAGLADVRVLMAIRERTRLDAGLLDRLPRLELVLQNGGHAYHLDEAAATARGIVVALGRRARMPSAAVPELTFGLMIAVLRRIHPLAGRAGPGGVAVGRGRHPRRAHPRHPRPRPPRPAGGADRRRLRHAGAGLGPDRELRRR